jgi:tetratricopeptide (TPR) repeat protein
MVRHLSRFPVRVAAGAALFYMLTLSFGVTWNSLGLTAKVAGWAWQPLATQPVLWLLTLPLRLLSGAWVPTVLNLFSAIYAAGVLGILARSLELLPWFRPLGTLTGWKIRLPALLAVTVCGLEFNFWQEATAGSGEMLDLLLLVAALWCLLEYRTGKNLRWLHAAALIWGLGMAENWVMIFTLPLFVVGVIAVRGLSFFERNFILSMLGLGLAGTSVYVLLPLANGLLPGSPWGFGAAWSHTAHETWALLRAIHGQFWVAHRLIAVAVLVFFLVPTFTCLVQLPEGDTETVSPTDRFQIWIYRGLRAALLLLCVWLAFDPLIGPRQILLKQLKLPMPLLDFDCLNALGAGFLAGNLLLAFQNAAPRRRQRFDLRVRQWLGQGIAPALAILWLLATLGLVARNAPAITLANRQSLTEFGELAWRSLPPGGGFILSDDSEKLMVFQAAQARHAAQPRWLAVDTQSLPAAEYRAQLERLRPGLRLVSTNRHELAPHEMLQLVARLAATNNVFYLHPSIGYFFELFYQQPSGSTFQLIKFQTNSVNPPPLPAAVVAQTEKTWDEFDPRLEALRHAGTPTRPALVGRLEKKLRLEAVTPRQIRLLEEWYSMALNGWGVELQRNGYLAAAQRRFTQALALNPDNWVAKLNLVCNTNLQAGTKMDLAGIGELTKQLGKAKQLSAVMNRMGPLDAPVFCYLLGDLFQQEGLPRLALQQFDRARTLVAPEVLGPQFALAELYAHYGLDDQALQAINRLRAEIITSADHPLLDANLSFLEAQVCLSQTNFTEVREVLQSLARRYPENTGILNRVAQAYLTFNDFTNAEPVVAGVLAREPDNLTALEARASILSSTDRAAAAVATLNHILALTNSPPIKLIRAAAHLQTKDYPAAKADFLALQFSTANKFLVNLGLAEIALQEHDTNQAILYYQRSLTNAPPRSPQSKNIRAQLDSLTRPTR